MAFMAAYGSPELLFLDEPTTGLDPSARDALWAVVADLRTQGVTVLLTTHYLEEAEAHADRIGLMHQGVLQREGTLAELNAGTVTTLRFTVPGAWADLPLAVTRTENGLAVVESDDPQRDITTLFTWAAQHGHRIDRFSAQQAGLDDIFRSLSR